MQLSYLFHSIYPMLFGLKTGKEHISELEDQRSDYYYQAERQIYISFVVRDLLNCHRVASFVLWALQLELLPLVW